MGQSSANNRVLPKNHGLLYPFLYSLLPRPILCYTDKLECSG